jgi:uncharacterized metal-binding protein YceD (DUF177 family)
MNAPTPEFSRIVSVAEALQAPLEQVIEADPAERAALAERLGLLELRALRAELRLAGIAGGTALRLTGTLHADLDQRCVVSLEPVPVRLDVPIDEEFALGAEMATEVELDAEIPDREPLSGDALDIGEVVAQCLSLSLDPYPKRSDAELAGAPVAGQAVEEGGPFAELARLKRNRE